MQRINVFVEHFWIIYQIRFEKIKKEVRIVPSNVSYDVLHHLSRFIQYKRYSIRFLNNLIKQYFSIEEFFLYQFLFFLSSWKYIRDILIKFSTDTDDQNLLNKLLYSTVSRDCILHTGLYEPFNHRLLAIVIKRNEVGGNLHPPLGEGWWLSVPLIKLPLKIGGHVERCNTNVISEFNGES